MASHLEQLARYQESDPFFLGCLLAHYARSLKLDDAGLADKLGCTMATLTLVKLCRSPAEQGRGFQDDVERIAGHFNLNAEVLEEMVRRGQVVERMQRAPSSPTLRAARDRDTDAE